MSLTIKKKEFFLRLFLIYCSYRAFISEFFFDIQPIVIVFITLGGIFNFFSKKIYRRIDMKFMLFLTAFWTYILVNGIYFLGQDTFAKGVTQYILFLMPLFAFWGCVDELNFDSISAFLIYINLPNAVGSIYEGITGSYILSSSHSQFIIDNKIRTAAFIGDMISLPLVLGFSLLFCVYLYIKSKNKKYIVYGVLNFIGIIASQSRGPLVAIVVAMVSYYLISGGYKNSRRNYGKIFYRVFIVLLVAAMLYLIIVHTRILDNIGLSQVSERVKSIFAWENSERDHSNATRVFIWNKMLQLFLKNPMIGIGIGLTGSDISVTIGATESAILKRLVELGISGTFLNFLMLLRLLQCALKKVKMGDENCYIYAVVLASIVIIFVEGVVLQVDEYFAATSYMWCLASLLLTKNTKEID